MNDTPLNSAQLQTVCQNSPLFEKLEKLVPHALEAKLADLQIRAGSAYASGQWSLANGQSYSIPAEPNPPTLAQTQEVLGQTYLALEDKKAELKAVMNTIGLTPSAQRSKGLIEQIVDGVRSMFR